MFGAADQLGQRVVVQPPEDQHLAAREERGIQFEARVLGRRADERDRAVLDIRQEAVLLRAVEAVDLVHEQQGALTGAGGGARFGEHLFQVGDAREDSGNSDEAHADSIGEQPRDGGLARARRPPQDHRGELAGGDHSSDRAVGAGQMLLADDLVQRPRTEAIGERRIGGGRLGRLRRNLLIGEEVGHWRVTIRLP